LNSALPGNGSAAEWRADEGVARLRARSAHRTRGADVPSTPPGFTSVKPSDRRGVPARAEPFAQCERRNRYRIPRVGTARRLPRARPIVESGRDRHSRLARIRSRRRLVVVLAELCSNIEGLDKWRLMGGGRGDHCHLFGGDRPDTACLTAG
jgi:hypothetical protein